QRSHGLDPWAPFASREEWELARWIHKSNLSQRATDEFLKGSMTRSTFPLQYHNFHDNKSYLSFVQNSIPGPQAAWTHTEITVSGNVRDACGRLMTETLDLWGRDPVHIAQDLIGHKPFDGHIVQDKGDSISPAVVNRIYEQVCDSEWWKDIMVSETYHNLLPPGATIAPVILASDKTQLSTFSGDKQAWPVYITIGNIDKETRRQPSKRATVLLGYLPVTKLLCFEGKDRQAMGYRLFHYTMSVLLRPLIDAGEHGIKMTCADGLVRNVYPVLAAYIADFPEQCLVACCKQNRCPICKVNPNQRGELLNTVYYRDPPETLEDLANGNNENLSSVKKPFWADLPYANIFRCITPDLLHQLHKGMFKDHLVKWTTEGYTAEIDERFKCVPSYPGVRIFRRGISKVTQWTGNEYRQMQKVFLPILCGIHDDPRVITAARALMDFIFLAHYPAHSTNTLEAMKVALRNFHDNKDVFIDLGMREDFNIPKLHAMNHYVAVIILFGSCDGLSTKISECLHIDLAKNVYRATNCKQYLKQMVLWLERQDKMSWFESYLDWAAP
ncbi:hypothetical protein C8Q72DRAFT_753967, partial [Fomitopsis betulina]